jgi:hypothetical protein
MKRAITFLVILVVILLVFISCEKEADNIKYPVFKQKLVVYGILSPGNEKNYISVNSTINIYGPKFSIVKWGNMTATISNGTNEISLDTTIGGYVFRSSDFPVEEGKTYTLRIISDFGLSAEASCTVPFRRNLNIEIDTTMRQYYDTPNTGNSYTWINLDLYFNDFKGETNYYRLLSIINSHRSTEPKYNSRETGNEFSVLSDKGHDGEKFKITMPGYWKGALSDSTFLKAYLLNTDKAYYDYQKSLENYSSGEDPFTEPSPLYTNITGGLGIFAAYTVDSLIYRLK